MSKLDKQFQSWIESLPIGFINYLYNVYKFNQAYHHVMQKLNDPITPSERNFINELTLELNKRIKKK